MRINETYPTTNISNNNNYQSVGVKRKSPPFIIKLNTFLTNKEASKHCSVVKYFGSGVVCIFTRHTGSSKYGTTRKNTQRYYTPKSLMRCIHSPLVLHPLQPNNSFSRSFYRLPCARLVGQVRHFSLKTCLLNTQAEIKSISRRLIKKT